MSKAVDRFKLARANMDHVPNLDVLKTSGVNLTLDLDSAGGREADANGGLWRDDLTSLAVAAGSWGSSLEEAFGMIEGMTRAHHDSVVILVESKENGTCSDSNRHEVGDN